MKIMIMISVVLFRDSQICFIYLSKGPAGQSEVRAYTGGESGGEKVREVNPEEGGCGVLV